MKLGLDQGGLDLFVRVLLIAIIPPTTNFKPHWSCQLATIFSHGTDTPHFLKLSIGVERLAGCSKPLFQFRISPSSVRNFVSACPHAVCPFFVPSSNQHHHISSSQSGENKSPHKGSCYSPPKFTSICLTRNRIHQKLHHIHHHQSSKNGINLPPQRPPTKRLHVLLRRRRVRQTAKGSTSAKQQQQ